MLLGHLADLADVDFGLGVLGFHEGLVDGLEDLETGDVVVLLVGRDDEGDIGRKHDFVFAEFHEVFLLVVF